MFTKIPKHKSKPISKVVDVIYYGGCQLKTLKGKLVKSTWMKAQVKILKTCSLSKKYLEKKSFQNTRTKFEIYDWFCSHTRHYMTKQPLVIMDELFITKSYWMFDVALFIL